MDYQKMFQEADEKLSTKDLTLNQYQERAQLTAQYPREEFEGVVYTTMGLVGEAGEIANKVKKVLRGDKLPAQVIGDLIGEVGDVLWYCAMLARELGFSLEEIGVMNLQKLAHRQERDLIKGDGDER